ncbi:14590_t:CDS:2 [Funneliformis geosporum]|nr:14590_t:CDS:2 [Funneliformis geosporum]
MKESYIVICSAQVYKLNEKSDVYSVGILLWEISSGHPPFCTEGESYDFGLALDILQGLRETTVPGTPNYYARLYTCSSNKLADFGLSKRIQQASNHRSKLFGLIPYIDPGRLCKQKNKTDSKQVYRLNEKSDVYSVGVLLWEISSGHPPFCTEGESHDFGLALDIILGLRPIIILDNPDDYARLYTDCWDGEPENRPSMSAVVERLKTMISPTTKTSEVYNNKNLSENDLRILVDEAVTFIFKELTNKGKVQMLSDKPIIDFLKIEISHHLKFVKSMIGFQISKYFKFLFFTWLFSFFGLETSKNYKKALDLFMLATRKNHTLAQCYVGICYDEGRGVAKDVNLAFDYYLRVANKDFAAGQLFIGYRYEIGLGIIKSNLKKAIKWYTKAANNGNVIASNNLGNYYKNGKGVKKDYHKAIKLFQYSAKGNYSSGILNLGYCGIGININMQKAFELYETAANLENKIAQFNLACMYENGNVIDKGLDIGTKDLPNMDIRMLKIG